METAEITVRFTGLEHMRSWAQQVVTSFNGTAAVVKELPAAKKTEKEKPEPKEEKPEGKEAEKKTILDELKDVGIQLSNADRYEGVQVCLAKYKVQKLKDIPADQQAEVLGYFNKMLKADKEKYTAMVDFLKS